MLVLPIIRHLPRPEITLKSEPIRRGVGPSRRLRARLGQPVLVGQPKIPLLYRPARLTREYRGTVSHRPGSGEASEQSCVGESTVRCWKLNIEWDGGLKTTEHALHSSAFFGQFSFYRPDVRSAPQHDRGGAEVLPTRNGRSGSCCFSAFHTLPSGIA